MSNFVFDLRVPHKTSKYLSEDAIYLLCTSMKLPESKMKSPISATLRNFFTHNWATFFTYLIRYPSHSQRKNELPLHSFSTLPFSIPFPCACHIFLYEISFVSIIENLPPPFFLFSWFSDLSIKMVVKNLNQDYYFLVSRPLNPEWTYLRQTVGYHSIYFVDSMATTCGELDSKRD